MPRCAWWKNSKPEIKIEVEYETCIEEVTWKKEITTNLKALNDRISQSGYRVLIDLLNGIAKSQQTDHHLHHDCHGCIQVGIEWLHYSLFLFHLWVIIHLHDVSDDYHRCYHAHSSTQKQAPIPSNK